MGLRASRSAELFLAEPEENVMYIYIYIDMFVKRQDIYIYGYKYMIYEYILDPWSPMPARALQLALVSKVFGSTDEGWTRVVMRYQDSLMRVMSGSTATWKV